MALGETIITWILSNPQIGWVGVILYLMWEIRGPRGKINHLYDRIEGIVNVVRALARVHQDIDTQMVDEQLVENGAEPGDFIDQDSRAYSTDSEEEPGEDQSPRRGDD